MFHVYNFRYGNDRIASAGMNNYLKLSEKNGKLSVYVDWPSSEKLLLNGTSAKL